MIFTCISTRAIHLELASTLNSSSTIVTLRRFSGRRGTPKIIYSDNVKKFMGINKELATALRSLDLPDIIEKASQLNIKWKFNPPTASHMGGACEKLIRSVKTTLNYVLREQNPKKEVLHTLSVEIEHSVNSRPLTHVSCDSRDSEPLTPNHVLLGSSSGQLQLSKNKKKALFNYILLVGF